ncbi:MAG: LAGLIDADG family homing endonuclease [Candidatus Woesearchaeota archaeon]
MKRLTKTEIQQIEQAVQDGSSLNSIAHDLNLKKTTVYYHFRKQKGKTYKQPEFTPRATEQEGEIIGIFAGDGSQYYDKNNSNYQVNVHFGLHARRYAEHVKELYESFFNHSFRLWIYKGVGMRIRATSRRIYWYFHEYLQFIPQCKHATVCLRTLEFPDEFLLEFLRGLFDTDGCLWKVPNENRTRIFYTTTSVPLAYQISVLLDRFGIKHGVYLQIREKYKPIYKVNVWKRSTETFISVVKPQKAKGS